jgi:hypothetical protein
MVLRAYIDQIAELRRVLTPEAEILREVGAFSGGDVALSVERAAPPRYLAELTEEVERAAALQGRLLSYVDDATGEFLPLGGSSVIRLDDQELAALTAALRARRDRVDEVRPTAATLPGVPATVLTAVHEHLALMDAELARPPFDGVEPGRLHHHLRRLRAWKREARDQIRADLLRGGGGPAGGA